MTSRSELGRRKRIAIFVSFSGEGGVERMIAHLCDGFLAAGHEVDLLLIKTRGSALQMVPAAVRRIKLGDHAVTCLPRLIGYLRRERPDALLSSKHRANQIAILARLLAKVPTRLLVKIETNLSASLARQNHFKRLLFLTQLRYLYPRADGVIGVSQGVCDDLRGLIGADALPFHTIYNPVLPRRLEQLAEAPLNHPWLSGAERSLPVLVAAGRVTRQKDFPTLVRAMATVVKTRPCRLIILGDGPEMERLKGLVAELRLQDTVDLHGFVDNPFPFLAAADLFVLSSLWEGFGNVLVEAMALGTGVVSTDCPSGPREILQDGRLGPLVTPGDDQALAHAILDALTTAPAPEVLRLAVEPYTITQSSHAHLSVLLG